MSRKQSSLHCRQESVRCTRIGDDDSAEQPSFEPSLLWSPFIAEHAYILSYLSAEVNALFGEVCLQCACTQHALWATTLACGASLWLFVCLQHRQCYILYICVYIVILLAHSTASGHVLLPHATSTSPPSSHSNQVVMDDTPRIPCNIESQLA